MRRSADRRTFLRTGARAIIGASAWIHSGCHRKNGKTADAREGTGLDALVSDLRRRIPKALNENAVPGCSIAVVRNGELAWSRGFGVADTASRLPVDEQTVFGTQSMSKPVFAYAVLKLCETGVLDLDTPLTRYTPERWVPADTRLDLITARHVLSHTSGFQNWRDTGHPLSIDFTPGSRWQYSGEGYSYLQSVVTRLTGHTDPTVCASFEADLRVCATDIGAYLKNRLLVPFGMTSSGYLWDDAWAGRVARPHDAKGSPLSKGHPTAAGAARYASSGGLWATATDYARFLIEVINPRPPDAFRLTPDSLRTMTRPAVAVPDEAAPVPGEPRGTSWALGWQVFPTVDGNVIAHGGDVEGAHSFAVASVSRRSAYVVMTNGDNGWKLTHRLIAGDEMHRLLTA